MSRFQKLNFDIGRLSSAGLKALRAGWCLFDDPNHLWLSKAQWFDTEHDNIYQETMEDTHPVDLERLFNAFLDKLALSPEDRAEIEALWAANPDNEVEWN